MAPTRAVTTASSSGSGVEPVKFAAPTAVIANVQNVAFVRGVGCAAAAFAVGILGITGAQGFLVYFLAHLLTSSAVLIWMGGRPSMYLPTSSPVKLLLSGVFENFIMYIFLWTLAYALVHVY